MSAAQSRVEAALRNMLPKKAVLACPAVYENSWDKFEEVLIFIIFGLFYFIVLLFFVLKFYGLTK